MTANYTWSHSLDDLSSTFSDSLQGGSVTIGSLGYTSLANPRLDWGSADFDVRQRLDPRSHLGDPVVQAGNEFEREALGGWNVSGIYTARGGVPFSVYDYDQRRNLLHCAASRTCDAFLHRSGQQKAEAGGHQPVLWPGNTRSEELRSV